MPSYVHLHLHSEYSLLDSSLRMPDLVSQVRAFDMPAAALTDHGNILGAVTFYKACRKMDIKPLVGCELYVASGSRFDRPDKQNQMVNYHHLVVLVKNAQGYRNLSELITRSFTEGFYRKPRVDRELLEKHRDGLLVLSACVQGEIPHHFLNGRPDKAREAAFWYRETFKDDFYMEIQDHGLSMQREVLPDLVQLSRELSVPLVATNDVHYLKREDADVREILICLQTNNVLSDPNRAMRKQTEEMYLKSGEEMARVFPDYPQALDITLDIAGKCNFDFKLGEYTYPQFQVPENSTVDSVFEEVSRKGFSRLLPTLEGKRNPLSVYRERLDYEIEKIRFMGFPGYFLIVWDIIRFCREVGILVGPGRGSVVGSFVAYCMGITAIDPLDYDLLFERFLNPERISMPDIDLDFDPERRGEVIDYIRRTYGEDCVCQIVTFGKMKAKLAIRDIGRVLEVPLAQVNRIAKLIPNDPKLRLQEELASNKELSREIQNTERGDLLIQYALKLENNLRQTGMHAAGVVIAPEKLTHFMPLYKTRDDIVSQFEKEEVEEIGLLKLDILGLKTLTIIKDILRQVHGSGHPDFCLDEVPLDDAATFRIFQEGDTDGIFQFESSGMRDFLRRAKPNRFEDLIALNALYRPGPLESGMADRFVNRKIGLEPVEYLFPDLEPILQDTYGIIVYQEQVMLISVAIAGFSMGKADGMRKIMGKKLEHKLVEVEVEFLAGAQKKGLDVKRVKELFDQIKTFARYGFNKSHSTAYGYLAYQTAYLKAHFPVAFMAAHLSNEAGKTSTTSKMIQYINEARQMGMEVMPPDINCSDDLFRVEGESRIRFGLKGIKGCGDAALASILDVRRRGGAFAGLSDLLQRVDLSKVNKTVWEGLIQSGALDSMGYTRRGLMEGLESLLAQASVLEKRQDSCQMSLFSPQESLHQITLPPEYARLPEWEEDRVITGEKEVAGMYITRNPLDPYRQEIAKVSNTTVAEVLAGEFKGGKARMAGALTALVRRKSKKGTFYGELYFEDLSGRIRILAFKDRWEAASVLEIDRPYFVVADLPEDEENVVDLFLDEIVSLESFLSREARRVLMKVHERTISPEWMDGFQKRLASYQGRNGQGVPCRLAVYRQDRQVAVLELEELMVVPTLEMKRDMEHLIGPNQVEIIY